MAIIGTEIASTGKRRTQVYEATHKGEQTLPFMNRSFISFTYGGKKIEDFNLIATITNNRLNRKGYAPFEDTVSTYSNLDGLYYWGTHYKANQLDFVLATDGIDLKDLDDFLYWFKAGTTRELILAEHPYRAILARVFEPPNLNLLPFLHEVTLNYSGIPYNITTTLYKGEINLSFTMDLPHWYGKVNILGEPVVEGGIKRYVNIWHDPFTNLDVDIFTSLDALKILYEDGIPLGSMIETNMLLGDGNYADVLDAPETKIWSRTDYSAADFYTGSGARIDGIVTGSSVSEPTYNGTEWLIPNGTYKGRIAGAIVTVGGNGIEELASIYSINSDIPKYGYFFYAGTAPSPVEISFTMTPKIDENTYYIISPCNAKSNERKYNTITIESVNKQEFKLTTPNLFTSYNKAIEVFDVLINGLNTWEDIRTAICNRVRHPAVRAWALKCIEYGLGPNVLAVIALNPLGITLKQCMAFFFINSTGTMSDVTFTFNSETGKATGEFYYRTVDLNMPGGPTEWSSYGEMIEVTEDVGDMLRSNYIIILDRNYPTDEGTIIGWETNDPVTNRKYTHRIFHDIEDVITNIQIIYKNRYL